MIKMLVPMTRGLERLSRGESGCAVGWFWVGTVEILVCEMLDVRSLTAVAT
jgi:hypothetical protein